MGGAACFDTHMTFALKTLQPTLVRELVVEHLLEYLDDSDISPSNVEAILSKDSPEERARQLLLDLPRRPASTFWKFLKALFRPSVGKAHIAVLILEKFKKHGGEVMEPVASLERDYHHHHPHHYHSDHHGHHHQQCGVLTHHPNQQEQQQQHQRQQQEEEREGTSVSTDLIGDGGQSVPTLSMGGLPVTTVEEISSSQTGSTAGGGTPHEILPIPSDDGMARTRVDSRESSVYHQKRLSDPNGVYTMDSEPRGAALIINIETFHHLSRRTGTNDDRDKLIQLFQHKLGFSVTVRNDLTAQAMRQELQKFAASLHAVDCCVVAILTHGGDGDLLYGTDGRKVGSQPVLGSYVSVQDMRDMFSVTHCRSMQGKPKLFILQACRGAMVDTPGGQLMLDVVKEDMQSPPLSQHPDKSDMVILHAAVDRYVAYRNGFIPPLVDVFMQNAHRRHVMDMLTLINRHMPQYHDSSVTFSIAEGKSTLTKDWFLNPPPQFFV